VLYYCIMRLNLDQTSDLSNKELYSYLNGINLPEFVKDSQVDDIEEIRYLDKEAFADEWNKAFPINAPSRVYISHAFFVNKKAELQRKWGKSYIDSVADKIEKAAKIFGVEDHLKDYERESLVKSAKDYSEDHVCTVTASENESFDLFPVKTKQDLEKAANTFANNINNFPYSWRQEISKQFIKKADEFQLEELPTLICKYAGLFYPDVTALKQKLWHRSTKIASEENKKRYEQLISYVDNVDSKEDVFKLAEIAYYIEKAEGVYDNPKVAQVIGDPVDSFFDIPIDKVAEILNVVEMAGEKYPVTELKKVSSDIYKEAFGIDIDPSNENQLREVLPTMPLSDVGLFQELSGLKPI